MWDPPSRAQVPGHGRSLHTQRPALQTLSGSRAHVRLSRRPRVPGPQPSAPDPPVLAVVGDLLAGCVQVSVQLAVALAHRDAALARDVIVHSAWDSTGRDVTLSQPQKGPGSPTWGCQPGFPPTGTSGPLGDTVVPHTVSQPLPGNLQVPWAGQEEVVTGKVSPRAPGSHHCVCLGGVFGICVLSA